jgi:hypothetical protein
VVNLACRILRQGRIFETIYGTLAVIRQKKIRFLPYFVFFYGIAVFCHKKKTVFFAVFTYGKSRNYGKAVKFTI